jgi:hypothetical protein
MPYQIAAVFAAALYAAASLTTALSADEPVRGPAEQAAVDQLKQLGGVLIHYNDRVPQQAVILVDFTNHPDFREDWLKHLGAFPHLTGLGLSGTSITDEGLRQLKKLRTLDTLTLAETKVTDEGLAELIELKALRTLDVRGTGVTADGATVLRRFLSEVEVSFGPMPGGQAAAQPDAVPGNAAPPAQPGPSQDKTALPSAAKIKELRQKAVELTLPGEDDDPEPEGWSKSWHDPLKVVELFRPLRVKKDHVLRAYLHREGGNGFGVVWALPADSEYPEPKDCPRLEHHYLRLPKPWDALDDTMEAIEGDDSAWSYLAASLLRRELGEFGALWHGIQWGTHVLLDDNPWAGGPPRDDELPRQRPDSQPHQWKWFEVQPANWAPQVRLEPDRAIVTFYTYTALAGGDDGEIERERIIRHTDTYRRGKYRSMTVEKKIAEGPDAIAF